jgi:hypothetical protein
MEATEAADRFLSGDISDPEVLIALNWASDDPGRDYFLLYSVVRGADVLNKAPEILKRVIKTKAWKKWRWMGRDFSSPSLGVYLTSHPPEGIGVKLPIVEKLIRDDPEALALFRKETTRKKGRPGKDEEENGYNMTINRPYRGTSKAYTLDRLSDERHDLFSRVKSGELSANAAAKVAGWRKVPTAFDLLCWAWKKATPGEREAFLEEVRSVNGHPK